MKNIQDLKGCGTALVTPFTEEGKIDETALKRLVNFQIDEGIDFLVPCGSTGESATLLLEEHLQVIHIVQSQNRGRVPVIAGAGGNSTAKVIEMAKQVIKLGVDGILSVTPYYNKPTQEGLYQHFKAISDAVNIPIIVYNVPPRTSTNLLPDTVVRLSEIENIIGIKEACGDIGQISELAVKISKEFKIISGDDAITLPIIALGGVGVISVVSNQIPKMFNHFVHLCLDHQFNQAMELERKLFPLMKANFIETNPIPVKAGLALMGMIEETYRLPLVPMSKQNKERLRTIMVELGLISS